MKLILWPMVWKEWRENARWAVLALIALALALGYQLYAAGLNTSSDPASALWNGVAPVFLFGCPLLGAALGFAQTMPELRRDQWAYLVHRPVPRTTLFWGKAVTGLGLALGATALPLGLLGLWAALPGDVAAPFDTHLLLPGVAALLTIVPFYFAGMLLALRPARWYGSRALPLAAAVLASVLTRALPEFWMAALAALVFGAVLCLAAWGCFATKGEYAGLPRSGRAGLGASLYVGAGLAIVTLIGLTVAVLSSLTSQPYREPPGPYYTIDTQGRVLRAMTSASGQKSATDLSGHPVPLAQTSSGPDLTGLQIVSLSNGYYLYGGRRTNDEYTKPTRYVLSLTNGYQGIVNSSGEVSLWYYLPAERRGVGYRQKTRRVFGYVGPTGFSPASQPDTSRFEVPYPAPSYWYEDTTHLYRYPNTVYWLDISAVPVPIIHTLYAASSPGEIAGAGQIPSVLDPRGKRSPNASLAAVAAAGQFFVYTPDGQRLFALPREYDPAQYDGISLSVTPDGQKYFFWYSPSQKAQKAADGRLPQYITETAATGAVTRRYTLPPLPARFTAPSDVRAGLFGVLSPPMVTVAFWRLATRSSWDEPGAPATFYLFLACSLASGVLGGVLMALISRRCGDMRRAQLFWAILGLPLGLFGVLMLLGLRPWPGRVPCPNCGRPRDVDRDECPHCGAAFPRPAKDGTEIFDGEAEKTAV